MDSGNQGQPSQARGQQSHAPSASRNTNNGFTGLGSGSAWGNSQHDNLARDNTAGTTSNQRSNAFGPTDKIWQPPGLHRWNSTDSQQFRSGATRSTSPPNPLQNASTASSTFPNPLQNGSTASSTFSNPLQNASTASSTFPTHTATKSNASYGNAPYQAAPPGLPGLPGYPSYTDNAQGSNGVSQQSSLLAYLAAQDGQKAYDGIGARDSLPFAPRQSETQPPAQVASDTNPFSLANPFHARHAQRQSLGGMPTPFAPQQAPSRAQSQSFLQGGEHAQAVQEAAQNHLLRTNLRTNSPGPRSNGLQANSVSAWPEYAPIGNDYRRDSQANSVHHGSTNTNSPFTGRQADPWGTTPAQTQDFDSATTVNRLQRQLDLTRLGAQSPYADANYMQAHAQTQAMMQQMQMHSNYAAAAFQGYGFQHGQQFFAPIGPAGTLRNGRVPDPNHGIRSQQLEEFRRSSRSNRKWELKNVFGQIVEFAGDQQGSRFLQEKIPTANSDDRQRVFDEIMVNANALMVDVFGNYVIQQLFQHGTMVQKKLLAAKMKDRVVDLSEQLYGCRCVQEAIQYVLVEQQVELAQELETDILRVMKDDNGNHVVQKVLSRLPRNRIDFIYDAVRGRVFELSQQQFACRVIQRMIEKGSPEDKEFLLSEFQEVAPRLVTDNWGNYVVQAVIRQGGLEARSKVIRLCIDQFLGFSKQKVASNVMEHCIEYGTEENRLEMYRLVTSRGADGNSLLHVMWKDNFANYVVQKLCHCLTGAEQAALVKQSRPYFESRKKPSRPDDKWVAFETLINQFSVPSSRQGSISSINGGAIGVSTSRPISQSDSAMPTPGLTTGANSPRTSSSQDTGDANLEQGDSYLADQFSKASLRDVGGDQIS